MSITGSLVGYENNNDVNGAINKKNRSMLNMSSVSSKQCTSLNSSISNSVITTASSASNSNTKHQNRNNECKQHNKKRRKFHLNSLWSIWYGVLTTALQGYLALHGAYRFVECSMIQWRGGEPYAELNIQLFLSGFVFLMLPLFFISTIFKVGNLANDGIKLATGSGKCSIEPEDGLEAEAKGGTLRALWTHGGPTSSFVHIITALCLLVPRLLLEARLIENGNLQRENIWRTELDFMVTHKDRLVILSFMTSPYQNISDTDSNNAHPDNAILYEKTHLIEKFRPDFDDDDLFDTHERLVEMESPTTMETFHLSLNNANTPPPTPPDKQTTFHVNENHNKKSERPTKTGVGNRHSNNGKGGNGKKHAGKHEGTHKSHKEALDEVAKLGENGSEQQQQQQQQQRRKNSRKGGSNGGMSNINIVNGSSSGAVAAVGVEDVNEKLEIKPNRIDFEKINDFEVSTVFEVTKNAKKIAPSNSQSKSVDLPEIDEYDYRSHKPDVTNGKKVASKDSDIVIVKPEKPTERIIPSTPHTTDSKIIEIKPSHTKNTQGAKKIKRFTENEQKDFDFDSNETSETSVSKDDGNTVVIEPAALIGSVPVNVTISPVELDGIAGRLQRFLGVTKELDMNTWSRLPSLEFLNLIVSLMVWSVRYPAVFWGTSKAFSMVFSLQMIINSIDILLGFAGGSVLYKLQIVGAPLPLQAPALLLNAVVTISLFILSTVLVISSSLIIYLYGHGRLSARIRDRQIISTKSGDTWAYFAHCASLCFILALAVVKAPLMHDLSATYRGSLDAAVLASVLTSVTHLFLWIVLWLGLTAKRRWTFKLPPLQINTASVKQPLLLASRVNGRSSMNQMEGGEDTIYWPKLAPNSPKLKVTFNEIPSTLSSDDNLAEHDGKRRAACRTSLCMSSPPNGEADDGDYATLRGPGGDLLHLSDLGAHCDMADDTSEEGKLLESVRDDSVTYASTRDLEPPLIPTTEPFIGEQMISPLAPVTVTVHTNEAHILTSTPRCLRRADSGVPTDALLTPRSDTTSTECSTSPPDRSDGRSETSGTSSGSSGVHSGEERDEVTLIRPRAAKPIVKPPQPVIQEEPFGRSTNMKMSSFNNQDGKSSATLPLTRGPVDMRNDFMNHCSTMPLPVGCHQQQYRSQIFAPNSIQRPQLHTTLPNGLRYSNVTSQNFLRRMPHVKNAESPYGILGLGAGHHTFSKLLHDPLMCHSIAGMAIPEDRDSANYSMISDHDREMYVNTSGIMH